MSKEITVIYTEYGKVCCCDNCGAFASKPEDIKHHSTCKPGESKFWQDFYENANEEEREFNDNL